jgi:hypothetical protein
MNIPYATRSRFFEPLHEALTAHGKCPGQGNAVTLTLSEEGYDGEIIIEISADPFDEFLSNWEGRDPTRFPARIRAAATVLRERRCFGRFLISHRQGLLSITPAP